MANESAYRNTKATNPGWEKIASVASTAFMNRGFRRVTLQSVSAELGIKPASIYYHCPAGKEQLFEKAILWRLGTIGDGLRVALNQTAEESFVVRVRKLVDALFGFPHIDVGRLVSADFSDIRDPDIGRRIIDAVHREVFAPFLNVVQSGQDEVRADIPASVFASALLSVVESIRMHAEVHPRSAADPQSHALELSLRILVDGMLCNTSDANDHLRGPAG